VLTEKEADFKRRFKEFEAHRNRLLAEGFRGSVYFRDGEVVDRDRSLDSLIQRIGEVESGEIFRVSHGIRRRHGKKGGGRA